MFKEFFKRVIPKKRFQNVDIPIKKLFTVGDHVNHLEELLLRKLEPTLCDVCDELCDMCRPGLVRGPDLDTSSDIRLHLTQNIEETSS